MGLVVTIQEMERNKIVFLFHKNNSTVLTAKKGFYKSYIYKDRDNNILGRSNTKMNDEEIRNEESFVFLIRYDTEETILYARNANGFCFHSHHI